MTPPHRWHPFDVVARVLAERLRGRGPSPELRAAVARVVDWAGVVGLASGQHVLAALAAALRDLGLSGSLEPELREFLAAVHAANVERNAQLREQLAEVVATLNRIGVEPVLLKGAIRLVDGLYPDPGWRMMRDLDVLVPETRFADAAGALRAASYAPGERAATKLTQERTLSIRRSGWLVQVELHRELFRSGRQRQLLRADDVIDRSRPIGFDGVQARLPPAEHQITHLIGHSQVHHRSYAYGRIELRDQLEAAALVRWSPESIDWEPILARFVAADYRRPLLIFLLSLNDGGAFCAVPTRGGDRIDALTALQRRRIALQAWSAALMHAGIRAGWCAAWFRELIVDCEARRRLAKLVRSRKGIARKFIRGPELR